MAVNRRCLRNTAIGNFLDRPSISIPCHSSGAAPVGFMLTGEPLGDRRLFAVALGLEAGFAAAEPKSRRRVRVARAVGGEGAAPDQLHQHLAEIAAVQQVDERLRRASIPSRCLAVADPPRRDMSGEFAERLRP